jgi:hypothetical protein
MFTWRKDASRLLLDFGKKLVRYILSLPPMSSVEESHSAISQLVTDMVWLSLAETMAPR